ncbi:Dyp-type peroxidase [Kineosporia sp. R_H_3]|uniref:Dyp-type peroxidase n=1 Tax=Kineosporia sp. R_H_3 TaxID=1961848 RepID=UPI0018E9D8F0|nr:Dyp-type peroxidase [Kineosporia sp. R_H_3]
MSGPSRRQLLTTAGVAAGGAAATGLGLVAVRAARTDGAAPATATTPAAGATDGTSGGTSGGTAAADAARALRVEPFHGPHQNGVATPAPEHATFVALDLRRDTGRAEVARLMRLLSDDAAYLTQGRAALADTEPWLAARPAGLTVTFGWGPRLFDLAGLAAQRPAALADLPAFRGEKLEDRWSGGDLLLQVCADEPTTVSHAVRMLTKDARRFATVRWVQNGFKTPASAGTPRNLLGQVDGTVNPKDAELDAAVWHEGAPDWFAGGTVLVLRRISLTLETWDAFDPAGKELVLGRRLDTGAPLTGTDESDLADLDAVDEQGFPVIDDTAHIRLAKARTPAEVMLRRGFNFDAGPGADGSADVGLLFAAYQRDPRTAFVPVQRRLAATDAMNRWVSHVGSAVFALPPGCAEGGFVGEGLLA